jgi:hypothetical protein
MAGHSILGNRALLSGEIENKRDRPSSVGAPSQAKPTS